MSIACALKNLTQNQRDLIQKLLVITPDEGYVPPGTVKNTTSIVFFKVVGDTIYLPFTFGSTLLGKSANIDKTFPNVPISFTGQLRENQVSVEQESWEQLLKYGTTLLALDPGFGKTVLGAYLAAKTKLLTVVLMTRTNIMEQWLTTFTKFTDAGVWVVGENCPPTCSVIICMKDRWDKIPENFRAAVGLMIVDEAHMFCTPSAVDCLLAFQPLYLVLETATPDRDDGLHSMLEALGGTHGVYRSTFNDLAVVKVVTGVAPEVKKAKGFGKERVDYTAMIESLANNPQRNALIYNLITNHPHHKALILVSRVDHAKNLTAMFKQNGVKADYLAGSKSDYLDAQVLIGTVSKVGTGFDQANYCKTYDGIPFNLIIIAFDTKKTSLLHQTVGRGYRSTSLVVLHLVDDFKTFENHWISTARPYYRKRTKNLTEWNFKPQTKAYKETVNIDWSKHI